MNRVLGFALAALLAVPAAAQAQDKPAAPQFDDAAASLQQQLQDSVAELSALREQLAAEKLPLSRQLRDLEAELVKVRQEYQQTNRLLDSRTLDLSNLRAEIKSRQDETAYLSNLLGEYTRNFDSRLHIAELDRYEQALEAAKLAPENTSLTEQEVFQAQAALLAASIGRLEDALGGTRFEGSAVDTEGNVEPGTFVMVGPAAIFRSKDGSAVGVAEQRLGSLEPAVIPFGRPEDTLAASELATSGSGRLPFDASQGNALKVEAIEETLWEHILKGGAVMWPILGLAAAALLVALFKWVSMMLVRLPSRRRLDALIEAVAARDESLARERVAQLPGPIGRMLTAGVEHLREPKDLIEEVMYERLLATRLRLNSWLPFVAIAASSAPLLGLLGTVTGIMNTFSLMTVFGTGDVKTLSSGISEALITTEYGLIVAIPSLLLHAFLSRKSRGIQDEMEKAAIAFVNQVAKTPFEAAEAA